MKAKLRWLVAWILYGMGHVVSIPMNSRLATILYPIYNWLMVTSGKVQGYNGEGPWGPYPPKQ